MKRPRRKEILLTRASAGIKLPLVLEAVTARIPVLHYHSFPFDLATLDVISRAKRFHSL